LKRLAVVLGIHVSHSAVRIRVRYVVVEYTIFPDKSNEHVHAGGTV